MKSANGGFWYKVGSLRGWRRGSEEEVTKYIDHFTTQQTVRHSNKSHSWRALTRENFAFRHRKT